MDLAKLKDSLIEKKYNQDKVSRFIAYCSDELSKNNNAVSKHSQGELYNLFVKYYNAGTNIDGINVVLTGKNMALITANGYKNKILSVYPKARFDIGLVREGDDFKSAKESGAIVYSHSIANPFEDKKIIGAYCVIRLNDGTEAESIETLNPTDFQKMKDSSRNQSTWNKWESEFWKKSVIKRACKANFAEEVRDLDTIDNTDYGLEDEKADEETKNEILKSHAKAQGK